MDGDYYDSDMDLNVAGPGVPLTFTRTYDATLAQASNGIDNGSGLGPGWTDNLAMSVSATAGVATVTESDGAQVPFNTYNASNAWCSSTYNYCPVAPRDIATLNQNTDGTWTFTDNIGTPLTYTFSSLGALRQITNSTGQSITASNEVPGAGSGSSLCPSSATTCTVWTSNASTSNPTLTEVFTSGQLTQVVGFAGSGGTAPNTTFCYYGNACTSATSGLAGSLYSATDAGSLTTRYTYDATNSTSQYQYDLLTKTDPDGGMLTNIYNTSGQISQQTDPSGVVTSFSYSGTPTSSTGGTTTVSVTPGSGLSTQVTEYSFFYGELFATTLDAGSSAATTTGLSRSPITGQVSSSTDPNGNTSTTALPTPGNAGAYLNAIDPTSTTDGVGNTTLYAYTPSNEVWCEVVPAEVDNGVTCPSTEPTTPPTAGAKSTVDPGATITYYDAAGNPTYVTDPLGQSTETAYTTAYTSAELPWCTVDGDEFTTAGISCPASTPISPPTGTATGYTTTLYNSAGSVTSVTNPTGATTSYAYANTSFPDTATQITDPAGDLTTITLDAAGQPTSQTQTSGSDSQTTITAYDSAGRAFCTIAGLAYAQGHTSCPASEPTNPPATGTNPWPGAQVTIFNDDGQPLFVVNPLGGVTQTAYDGAGNAYCSVTPTDYAQGITCPAPGQAWVAGTTIALYDAFGRPVQVTNPLGGVTTTAYDSAGNVLSTTVESNNTNSAPNIVTQNSYDADNRLISSTLGAGSSSPSTTLTGYDPDSNAFCTVSANADAAGTSAYQCPAWQPSWIAAAPIPTALYSTTPTAAQGNNVTTTFFNADGQQVQSTNPDVQTTVSAPDADGNNYCSADATNVAAWLTAHPSGIYPYLCPSAAPTTAPAQGSNPGYVTTIFDANGHTVSSTDQAGDTTSYTYDPAGDVLTTTDPRGEVTTNCYYWQSAPGSCAQSAPAGGGAATDLYSTTTPATAADPSGALTTYTYFPGDLADVTTTPAGTATASYDAAGDLLSTTHSGTATGYATPATTSAIYNVDGTTHTMTDASGITTYGYDDMGDATSQALVAAGGLSNATTSYGYYSSGVQSSISYPSYAGHTNPQVTYAYDGTGAMVSSTDWLGNTVTFAHDADGNTTAQNNAVSTANPNGTSSTTSAYDAADLNTTDTSTLNQTCGGTETLAESFSGTTGSRNPDGQVSEDSSSYNGSCSGRAPQRSATTPTTRPAASSTRGASPRVRAPTPLATTHRGTRRRFPLTPSRVERSTPTPRALTPPAR